MWGVGDRTHRQVEARRIKKVGVTERWPELPWKSAHENAIGYSLKGLEKGPGRAKKSGAV